MTSLLKDRERGSDGRVVASYEDTDELYNLIRAAALVASAGDIDQARGVSMRRWETARKALDMPGPTRANGIVAATGHDWATTLRIAFADRDDRARTAGWAVAGEGVEYPDELLVRALQGVAFRLGRTPNRHEYDATAREIEHEHAADFGEELGLPSSATIEKRYASWPDALVAASLEREPDPRIDKLDTASLLSLCIDTIGSVPPKDWFREWAGVNGYYLSREWRTWQLLVERTRVLREQDGKDWPEVASARALGAPVTMPGREPLVKRPKSYSDEEKLASVVRYLDSLAQNELPTSNCYKAAEKQQPELGLLSYNAVITLAPTGQAVFEKARAWKKANR